MGTGDDMTLAPDGVDWQCYRIIGKACGEAEDTREDQ
jgi:hypothetical protein